MERWRYLMGRWMIPLHGLREVGCLDGLNYGLLVVEGRLFFGDWKHVRLFCEL